MNNRNQFCTCKYEISAYNEKTFEFDLLLHEFDLSDYNMVYSSFIEYIKGYLKEGYRIIHADGKGEFCDKLYILEKNGNTWIMCEFTINQK